METKEWDFGTSQVKVRLEKDQLSWKGFGKVGSSYPLRSVNGVQYEAPGCLSFVGYFVVLVAGGDNPRVQVPKTHKTVQLIAEINAAIEAHHQARTASAAPALSLADELAKLAQLKQQGILSEEEFQAQKQRLLAGKP